MVLVMFRNLRKSPEILGKCCDGFVNPGDEKTKLSDFELEKACKQKDTDILYLLLLNGHCGEVVIVWLMIQE